MRGLVLVLVLVSSAAHAGKVAVVPATVSADDVETARPTLVRGSLTGATATFRARYLVHASGMFVATQATFDLPDRAVATATTITADGTSHALALLPAAQADQRFNAVASQQGIGAPAWAATITGEPGSVTLGLASPRRALVTVELEMTVTTCYFRDARYVRVPASWRPALDTALRTPVHATPELLAACDFDPTDDAHRIWIAFAAPELAARRSGERIGVFASRLPLGPDHLARVELDLAGRLSDVPRDLATAIIVDASRSIDDSELATQREVIASYLGAAPASRVQVITFARRAQALLPDWTTAAQASSRIERELRALTLRNGSSFDAGLTEAARWLERVEGTRRILLFTDEQLADRLSAIPPATWRRLLPAGTLVHVIAVNGSGALVRDADATLAPLAAATDGIAVRGGIEEAHPIDATLLVRPISIDELHVTGPGWTRITPDGDGCGESLGEGAGCTWWGEGDPIAGPIEVAGELWGKRVTRIVRPDTRHAIEVARELSALSRVDTQLDDAIAVAAHAVNRSSSLFATWGGSNGYGDDVGTLEVSGCGCGGGSFSSSDSVGIGRVTTTMTKPPELEDQLRAAVQACRPDDDRIAITLEMTMLEIVEVTVEITPDPARPADAVRALHDCIEDAMWDASPRLPHALAHDRYHVAFGPK